MESPIELSGIKSSAFFPLSLFKSASVRPHIHFTFALSFTANHLNILWISIEFLLTFYLFDVHTGLLDCQAAVLELGFWPQIAWTETSLDRQPFPSG
jgi:hypothetical protein